MPTIRGGRREQARFPGTPAAAPSASTFDGFAQPRPSRNTEFPQPTLAWYGPEGPLEDIARDHAQAAGFSFAPWSPTQDITDTAPSSHQSAGLGFRAILAAASTNLDPLRRSRVPIFILTLEDPTVEQWRTALTVRAREVRRLPDESSQFLDDLIQLGSDAASAHVIVCSPGSGGAGASSLAVRLAAAGSRLGLEPILIDADPSGGGLDLLMAAAHVHGARWDALEHAGEGSADAIAASLPIIDGIRTLTFGPNDSHSVHTSTMTRVCHALTGHTRLLVIDTGHQPALLSELPEHTHLLVALAAEHQVEAAHRRLHAYPDTSRTYLALRRPRRTPSLSGAEIEELLQIPVALQFTSSPPPLTPSLDRRASGADAACLTFLRGTS